jgi:glycosyltransferase involved in cell wall biosynthesis
MIYLDVTSACQSPLNTGVKRMQRALHEWLRPRADYQPVCWQSARRGYRRLRPRDRENLENIAKKIAGLGLIDNFAPGAISDWLAFRRDRALMLPPAELTSRDVLLVPDLLWDNRGRILTQRRGPRLIGIFHDAIALRRPGQSRLDAMLCARGVRALAGFDTVLCISREAEHDLLHYWRKFGLAPAATRVVPWPVPFHSARPASPPNFPARQLLYVARLEPHKNHLLLLDTCEALWSSGLDFELRLIGCMAYPDTAWRILRRVRALRKKGRRIRWEAHVPEDELHRAYRDCTATVFPSLLEGFGLPVLESLWHGRPVICGGDGALGEIAAGGGCEIVDPQDRKSLADGIRRVLTDPARYAALCDETQTRHFRNWADYGRDLADLLDPA